MRKKTIKYRKDTLARKFAKLHKVDEEIKALAKHLKKKGFKPAKEKKNYWGVKNVFEEKDKKVTFTMMVQDYVKAKSKDGAAIGQITASSGERSSVYSFHLIAPKGQVKKAKEHSVNKKLKVIEANSWWDCVRPGLEREMPLNTGIALVDCAGIATLGGPFCWAVFLGCLAIQLGVVFFIVTSCCNCRCGWWCSWAVGCCRW